MLLLFSCLDGWLARRNGVFRESVSLILFRDTVTQNKSLLLKMELGSCLLVPTRSSMLFHGPLKEARAGGSRRGNFHLRISLLVTNLTLGAVADGFSNAVIE